MRRIFLGFLRYMRVSFLCSREIGLFRSTTLLSVHFWTSWTFISPLSLMLKLSDSTEMIWQWLSFFLVYVWMLQLRFVVISLVQILFHFCHLLLLGPYMFPQACCRVSRISRPWCHPLEVVVVVGRVAVQGKDVVLGSVTIVATLTTRLIDAGISLVGQR